MRWCHATTSYDGSLVLFQRHEWLSEADNMATYSDSTSPPRRSPSTAASTSPELIFPTAHIDKNLHSWLRRSHPHMMSASTNYEVNSLEESTYDIIDTDGESRDDDRTESEASTDVERPDDLTSLADTERSIEESDDENNLATDSIPAFLGLDGQVETPRLAGSLAYKSIEFEEDASHPDVVSVKHTVVEFGEERTAKIVKNMSLHGTPRRLRATVRQTMTKQGLSTTEPLRILYIGSHSARDDIIHKIASCVTASTQNSDDWREAPKEAPSRSYTVVPINAFGSSSNSAPEVTLVDSVGGYQINVQDCTSAINLKFENEPDKQDIIKLTIENNFSYHSVPEKADFTVEPPWTLPHVAIFYCTENDSVEARRSRTFARTFMSRHNVPSIVISHEQLFDRNMGPMVLDQHAIHMCLESRDVHDSRSMIHQRLPIDLASFLNIDARQMNRNLAYLTGLYEVENTIPSSRKSSLPQGNTQDIEKTSYGLGESVSFLRARTGAQWRALLPVGLLLIGVFSAALTGFSQYRSALVTSPPSRGMATGVTDITPTSVVPMILSSSVADITSTRVSTSTKTSTRTVTVTSSKAAVPNSLALMPYLDFKGIPDAIRESLTMSSNKSYFCEAAVMPGNRRFRLYTCNASKANVEKDEAPDVVVNRTSDGAAVKVKVLEKTPPYWEYSVPVNYRHGILNVTVLSAKSPKCNSMFQLDLGLSPMETYLGSMSSLCAGFGHGMSVIGTMLDQTLISTERQVSTAKNYSAAAFDLMANKSSTTFVGATKSLSSTVAKLERQVDSRMMESHAKMTKRLRTIRTLGDDALLKAQIHSKLYWLKLIGADADHARYRQRAAKALLKKQQEILVAQRRAQTIREKAERADRKTARREAKGYGKS